MGDGDTYHEPPPAKNNLIIYAAHGGVKNHVPLCELSKTPLHQATSDVNGSSHPMKLAELLDDPEMKSKINAQDFVGFTALHMACRTSTKGVNAGRPSPDTIACAALLIKAGADVNKKTDEWQCSQTPLHLAVSSLYPQVEICKMLVEADVELCAVDSHGNTPLHSCALGAHTAQLRVLVGHPDFDTATKVVNKEGQTALQLAEALVERQTARHNLEPFHSELVLLLQTGNGLAQKDSLGPL